MKNRILLSVFLAVVCTGSLALSQEGPPPIGPAPTSGAAPTGAAGGDLAGTYPNPTVAAARFSTPGPVGNTAASTGAFTTITASSSITGSTDIFAGGSNTVGINGRDRFKSPISGIFLPTNSGGNGTIIHTPNGATSSLIQVGAAGFTTAANTSLQVITGLTWNPPAFAENYSFSCHLAYSQATGNAAVAFGIQAATNAPTNIFAMGLQQITVGPPATVVTGILPTLTTTTATAIVSGTPTATATNYYVDLHGTLELGATTNAVSIMVSTATSGDAVSVLRGSHCQLY